MKKALSFLLAVVMTLSIFGENALTVSAVDNEEESVSVADRYEYSYGFLKYCLINYGDTNVNYPGYYSVSNYLYLEYTHQFMVYYRSKTDDVVFSYDCYSKDGKQRYFALQFTMNKIEQSKYLIQASNFNDVYGTAYVTPDSYNSETLLIFTLTKGSFSGPVVYDEEFQEVYSDAFEWGTREWNMLIYNNFGLTLGNLKFKNLYPENTDLYLDLFKVSFNTNGHGTAPSEITVREGYTINNPGQLTADGYVFKGWFKEASCKNAWNFSTDKVYSDLTLYAKWEKAACTHSNTYEVKEKVINSTCVIEGHYDKVTYCNDCGAEIERVTLNTGLGSHSFTKYVYNNDATVEKDGTETAKCDYCDAKDTRTKPGTKLNLNISIKGYKSSISVDYNSKLIFHTTTEAPDGYKIVWSNGQEGSTCTINKATDKEYKISAKLVRISDGSTVKASQEETVNVDNGFFAKIIAFFRGLFGSLPVYEDNSRK